MILTTLDRSLTVLKQVIFSPGTVSWNDVTTALLPLGLTVALLCFVIWSTRPTRPIQQKMKTPRRSDRIARKRAMLLSRDLYPLASSCEKASATPPNL